MTCSPVMEDTQYSTSADLSHHLLALLPFFSDTSTPLAGPGTEEDTMGKQFLLMSKLRDMATLLRSSCCGTVREPETWPPHGWIWAPHHHEFSWTLKAICNLASFEAGPHNGLFWSWGQRICAQPATQSPTGAVMEPSLRLFNKVLCSFLRVW